jgi:hypothetical protein
MAFTEDDSSLCGRKVQALVGSGAHRPPLLRARPAQYALALALGVVTVVGFAVRLPYCTDGPLRSDAADYFRSLRGGWASLYLDSQSIGLFDFCRLVRSRRGSDSHIWEYLSSIGDVSSLRHFHVPLAFYPHAIAAEYVSSARVHRLIPAAIGALTGGLCMLLMCRAGLTKTRAMLAALVVTTNLTYVRATTDFSPHPMFMLSAVGFLLIWSRYCETPTLGWLVASALAFSCSFAVIELAPALLVGAALLGIHQHYVAGQRLACWPAGGRRAIILAGGITLAAVVLIWPGGVIRGGYIKSYGVFAYQALFERTVLFGRTSAAAAVVQLLTSDPLLAAVLTPGILGVAMCWQRIRCRPAAFAIVVYAAISFVLNIGNHFKNNTYASEVLIFLIMAAWLGLAAIAARLPPKLRPAFAAVTVFYMLILVGHGLFASGAIRSADRHADEITMTVIQRLPQYLTHGAIVLTNTDAETYRLYVPGYTFWATETYRTLTPLAGHDWEKADCLLMNTEFLEGSTISLLSRTYHLRTTFGDPPHELRLFCTMR